LTREHGDDGKRRPLGDAFGVGEHGRCQSVARVEENEPVAELVDDD
jgi:hypothetical protein